MRDAQKDGPIKLLLKYSEFEERARPERAPFGMLGFCCTQYFPFDWT